MAQTNPAENHLRVLVQPPLAKKHSPLIQAAHGAGYRVKVTGAFGCSENRAAGADAPREPRRNLAVRRRRRRGQALKDERAEDNTEHV